MTRTRLLTQEQREQVRSLIRDYTKFELARRFGCSPSAIEYHAYPKVREQRRAISREQSACR